MGILGTRNDPDEVLSEVAPIEASCGKGTGLFLETLEGSERERKQRFRFPDLEIDSGDPRC
jgi:hypothetical protein